MMKNIRRTCLLVATLLFGISTSKAQDVELDLYNLSLEELMKISIVSASNEKEKLFDAPVSVQAVTREEISKAGILSIPEAMRLIPGVIVRETTNGNYDIHLRGFDNVAQYTSASNQINTLTLVMINNRPVFNYNMGGTFWESLPVGIADVERIEVVTGPSAPLFGPNAVTGVVNIITREFNNEQLMISGQVQGIAPGNGLIGSLALGKQVSEKLNLGLSGYYQSRLRLDDEQYVYGYGYIKSSDYRKEGTEALNLNPDLSLQNRGLNAYANYQPAEDISFNLSGGLQRSQAHKLHFFASSPLVHGEMNSFYGNLSGKIKSFALRFSYSSGVDELNKLSSYSTKYDYRVAETVIDYNLKIGSKIKIRPSLNYQATTYSDLDYLQGFPTGGLINKEASLNTMAGSLRAEYAPLEGLRLIGSGRVDKFNVSEDVFVSYQFASTYSPDANLIFRASHGKSYSGLFYNTAHVNTTGILNEKVLLHAVVNPDVQPTSNTQTEIGVRAQLKENLQADLGLFAQTLAHPLNLVATGKFEPLPTGMIIAEYRNESLPVTAHQLGLTASVNWLPNKQWQVRPFITLQKTRLRNFDYYNSPQFNVPAEKDHESTPSYFGGWLVNYTPFSRLNLNTSSYFFSSQNHYHMQDISFENNEGEISGKMLLNAKASYLVYDKLTVFAGAKNLLNQNTREFYGTDRNGSTWFAGLSYNF